MKKNKETYESPQTKRTQVNLESGFMADSVYKSPENTEGLKIESQKVDTDNIFDFSNEDQWKQ